MFEGLIEGEDSKCISACGDGILKSLEECDDGNTSNLDGCDSKC